MSHFPQSSASFSSSGCPVLPAPAADPWIFRHAGLWYSLQAVERNLQLRVALHLDGLRDAEPHVIWTAPQRGGCSRNLWAPELHGIDGEWYIYVAADDGRNENHRMWTLQASKLEGPWRLLGQLKTPGWAIDGSVIDHFGSLYFAWSGWPGRSNGQQNLYLAKMHDPWTLDGTTTLLTEPTEPWERRAMPLCEGPQWLRRGGRTLLVYSASGSWTPDYCLGMLVNDTDDLLDPRSWKKRGPVLSRTETVWGVGHCCFAEDEGGRELLFYHAKTALDHGWKDRHVLVQSFDWCAQGFPRFGGAERGKTLE